MHLARNISCKIYFILDHLAFFLNFWHLLCKCFHLISFLETVLNVWRVDNVLLESYNVIYPFQMGYSLKHCCKHL